MTKFRNSVLKYRAVPVATGLMTVATAFPAFASGASGSAASDATLMVSIVQAVMALFTTYPLNIFVAAGIATVGFKVFRSGKSAAK